MRRSRHPISQYVILDRVDCFRVETVQHLVGSYGRPTGERGMWCYCRVGGDPLDPSGEPALRLPQND